MCIHIYIHIFGYIYRFTYIHFGTHIRSTINCNISTVCCTHIRYTYSFYQSRAALHIFVLPATYRPYVECVYW